MKDICSHCKEPIAINFCTSCGQKKYKRIDKKYIWDELQYTLIHTNKGFFYSAKKVLLNPGKVAKDHINGDRVSHYKPLALLFLLSGIGGFIMLKVLHFDLIMKQYYELQGINKKFPQANEVASFMSSYNAFILLAFLPLIALSSKIGFKKLGHNYFEHIIINSYVFSANTIYTIVIAYPILYFVKNDVGTFFDLSKYLMLSMPIIMYWVFSVFYNEQKWYNILWRVIVSSLLIVAFYFAVILLLVIVIVSYLFITKMKQ